MSSWTISLLTMKWFLASVPVGHAILDTGCTTSVVGQVTADTLSEFMEQCGHPKPVPVALPPVELKGFNGVTEVTTLGLRWTCKAGIFVWTYHHIRDSWTDSLSAISSGFGKYGGRD